MLQSEFIQPNFELLTINVRHGSTISILRQHITELQLSTVHVLPGNEESILSTMSLRSSSGEDGVDLRREMRRKDR